MITCSNPNCRRPNKDSATYCVYCGHRLRKTETEPSRPSRSSSTGTSRPPLIVILVVVGLIAGLLFRGCGSTPSYEPMEVGYRDRVFNPGFEVPVSTGAIVLESTPKGARIRLDGKKTSYRTPATLTDLPEGEHDVRIEYRRRGSVYYFEDKIVVRGGQVITRRYRFSVGEKPLSDASSPSSSGPNAAGWSRRDMGERIAFAKDGCSFSLIRIPEGSFYMDREGAGIRRVSLDAYAIGETEVTRALWTAVLGSGSAGQDGSWPVSRVSYCDCEAFIAELNRQTGERFRLPTETEWEYAARGGRGAPDYWYAEPGNNLPDGFGDTGEYSPGTSTRRIPTPLGSSG